MECNRSTDDIILQGAVDRDSCPWWSPMVHTNKAFEDDIEDPVYRRDQTSDTGRSNPGAVHHLTLPSRSTLFQENLPSDATTSSSTTKALGSNKLKRSDDSSVILSTAQPPVADAYASLFQPGVSTEPGASYQETHPRPVANSDLLIQTRKELADHSGSDGGDPAPGFPEAGRRTVDPEFRLVSKCGRRHISSRVNRATRCGGYVRDVFTTMVDLEWKYHVVIWMASFCLSWVGFGFIWWFTIIGQPKEVGVAERGGNDTNSTLAVRDGSLPPAAHSCLARVQDFVGALLFSIETQSTIGYGWRYINSDCHPLGYILLFVQVLSGICIAFFLSGVIFKKLSRPYGRSSTILFSRSAVIQTDGSDSYRFAFRLGDIRKSHVIGTSIRALLVKDRLTREGERIPLCQYSLQLDTQSSISDSFIFMPWPIIVSHRIDASSPLWTVSETSLRKERFEIIVMFEGVVESTGASTQLRTSYLPSEILWGREFVVLPTVEKTLCNGHVSRYVDFGDFDRTVPTIMDSRSAKELSTRYENQNREIPTPLMTSRPIDEPQIEQNRGPTTNDDDKHTGHGIPNHGGDRDETGSHNDQQHQIDDEQLKDVSSRLKWKGTSFHTVGQHPCNGVARKNQRKMERCSRTDEATVRRTYSF